MISWTNGARASLVASMAVLIAGGAVSGCGTAGLRATAADASSVSINVGSNGAGQGFVPSLVVAGGASKTVFVLGSGHCAGRSRLVESKGGVAPFTHLLGSGLTSGNGSCSLAPIAGAGGDAIWAMCPQGMTSIWFHSRDGGRHFQAFWQPFQTDGSSLDPVSADIAYRWTGGGGGASGDSGRPVPASTIQQSFDGGASFTSLAPLPAHPVTGSNGKVVFLGGGTVDGYFLGWVKSTHAAVPTLFSTSNGGDSWSVVSF